MKQDVRNFSIRREVSLSQIFRYILSKLHFILLVGVILAIGVGIFAKFVVVPKYQTYTTMYVYTNPESMQIGSINNNDLLAAENLAGTYKEILQSNQVLNSVVQQIESEGVYVGDNKVTASQVDAMTHISIISDTQLLKVLITSEDPVLARSVASAFAQVAPKEIVRVTKAGGVEIVDYPELPKYPVSPKIANNCMFAFIIGASVSALVFIIKMIMDTTVYTPDDVSQITDLPSLGTIPKIAGNSDEIEWTFVNNGLEFEHKPVNYSDEGIKL